MLEKIDHIGIAVNSIDDAKRLYTDVLGLELQEIEEVPEQKVRVALIPIGESRFELLESTDPEGAIARHIERRGEGIHHLALEVDSIEDALATLVEKGVPLVDSEPREGVEGTRIAFLHPGGAKVLLELVETKG